MEEKTYDAAVLGGGPGGYTAAMYLARSGYSVVVAEKLGPGGQMAATERVDNYPGFDEGVEGVELGERMMRGAERFGARTLYAEVVGVSLREALKRIDTDAGTIYARAVIIATGAHPREMGLENERELTGRGVAYCAACDGMRYKGRVAVVAGGGNSAAADALYLARICSKVYLVHRRDALRASKVYLDPLEKSGVEILYNTRIERILHDDRVTGVLLNAGGKTRSLHCDALFVAIGRVPDTGLFVDGPTLDGQGYIVADETTRTSLPGVFAVGDVRTKPLRQIVTATADGAVASRFAEEYLQ